MSLAGSGFRIDVSKLRQQAQRLGKEVRAERFKPDILKYANVVLNTCVKTTPARDLATIKANQSRQYDNRINYNPSVHELRDPTLIVKPDGMWLYCSGKWYRPNSWNVPDNVWQVFETLLAEHLRRMDTPKTEFIAHRAQARFLYKKSWTQCGESLGLKVIAPQAVHASETRRDPPKNPPRGYAQIRGGQQVISVVIYNPFINDDSRYRDWDGAQIISDALQKHGPSFLKQVEKHIQRIAYAVMHS
jgi:hypothetical protein